MIFVTTTNKLEEAIDPINQAMHDWTNKAARGVCGWICSDCCVSFHEGRTHIIQRDKAAS